MESAITNKILNITTMSNMKRYFRGRGPSENQKRHELRETLEKTLLVLDKIDVAEVEDRVYKAQDMLDEIDSLMIKSKGNPQTKKNPPVDEDKKHTYDSIKDALRVLHQKQRTTTKNSPRPPPMSSRTDPSIKTTGVFGRDEDKKAIIQLLLSKNAIPSQIDIIAIVGIGGIGKTTLANLAYNDYAVEAHFDLCLWLTLSENFDYSNLTNAILQKISPNAAQPEAIYTAEDLLRMTLTGKRFLLVLDDVWSTEDLAKCQICRSKFGANGSKIIVTTHNENIASILHSVPYHLRPLPENDCWKLFLSCTFQNTESPSDPKFEDIGRKIVHKSLGLPLAIKSLGSFLHSKHSIEDWGDVQSRPIIDSPGPQTGILSVLKPSYEHLSLSSKWCFSFCSLFPKEHKFVKEKLVLLWGVAGLLPQPEHHQRVDDAGYACFNELVSMSFLVPSNEDRSSFIMHDMIHNLAQYVSKPSYFMLDDNEIPTTTDKVRHVSFANDKIHDLNKFYGVILDAKSLRTILQFTSMHKHKKIHLSKEQLHGMFSKLLSLRVLCLSHFDISTLPDSIGKLMHLRYLDLSHTPMKELSASIGELSNLEILLLSHCSRLGELPIEFVMLLNLCYLDITKTPLKKLPPNMSRLKNLHTLTNFVVLENGGSGIEELGPLVFLRTLCISALQNVSRDASKAKLGNKSDLDDLVLKWSDDDNSERATIVLDQLQPPKNLKRLTLKGYSGIKFPNWLVDFSFSNMVFLCIKNCKYCTELPPLGQLPSLKDIIIEGLDKIQKVSSEFYGINLSSTITSFPSLQTLTFKRMMEWTEWTHPKVTRGEFHGLIKLSLETCPKLKGDLPKNLRPSTIEKFECPNLKDLEEEYSLEGFESFDSFFKKLKVSDISELINLPPGLHSLKIEGCDALDILTEELFSSNPDLQDLKIVDCHHLKLFLRNCTLTTLRKLYIYNCRKLEYISPLDMVEYLTIGSSCDSLESISLASFPNLKTLSIWDCANLVSILVPQSLVMSLEVLEIRDCPKLNSFLTGGLCALNVTSIVLSRCDNLKHFPKELDKFISLELLSINECPELESFPEGGLPPNLSLLSITSCNKLTLEKKWGLHRLERLGSFEIEGGCTKMESFPEKNLLPNKLNFLRISKLRNLKFLNADELRYLSSLETLEINACDKLMSLPEDALPSSLSSLCISECPMLKSMDWLNIAHIPHIQIDGEVFP